MALTTELLAVLDHSEEPLAKRLRIADNAFKAVELPIQNREAFLLKWIIKATKTKDKAVWDLFLSWLESDHIKYLNRTGIGYEDVAAIREVIGKRLKHAKTLDKDLKTTILNSAFAVIENQCFQQNFMYNVKEYCIFVSSIIDKIEDPDLLCKFLKSEFLFTKSVTLDGSFHECFLENNVDVLGRLLLRFESREDVQNNSSTLVQKCLYQRNFKNFEAHLKHIFEEGDEFQKAILPMLLLKNLTNYYKLDVQEAKTIYRLIFNSYCGSYNNNFEIIYKFFIVLLESLGFKISNLLKLEKFGNDFTHQTHLNKSLLILIELLDVLCKNSNVLDVKIKDTSFSDFLRSLVLSIISLTNAPDENVYAVLNSIIAIDPLAIEKLVSEILVYTMLSDNNSHKTKYEIFLKSVFEVFSKLHRIQNLISKMVRAVHRGLEADDKIVKSNLEFSGEISYPKTLPLYDVENALPKCVLKYFAESVATLASWQVMNLFKTLIFHLGTAVDDDLQKANEDQHKLFYIEMLSTLTCQLLCSVKIADHTVPTVVVEKFVKSMEELKSILAKFGSALVNMEHNPALMRAFLNICYTWAELYIMLTYYATSDTVQIERKMDNDYTACNITYLHSYLSKEQWCLIAERITNFGEKPCKIIMQKLIIQKVKAMFIFEKSLNDDVFTAVTNVVCLTLEDNLEEIIQDKFTIKHIVTRLENPFLLQIAELLFKRNMETSDSNILQNVYISDCQILMNSILYVCLSKINRIFKHKRKHDEAHSTRFIAATCFLSVPQEVFLNSDKRDLLTLDALIEKFNTAMGGTNGEVGNSAKIDEEKLLQYLYVLPKILAIYAAKNIQTVYFLNLLGVLVDINNCNLSIPKLKRTCESLLIGFVSASPYNHGKHLQSAGVTPVIINNFERYEPMYSHIADTMLKTDDSYQHFESEIQHLIKHIGDENHLNCAIIVFNLIYKCKKLKISAEHKLKLEEYQLDIAKSITKLIHNKKDSAELNLIEAYTCVLKFYFRREATKDVEKLTPFLDKYIDAVMCNFQQDELPNGGIPLFVTILRYKSKLNSVSDNFVLKAWDICKNLSIVDKNYEEYSELIVLIFEHIPNEQFSDIAKDLFNFTVSTMNKISLTKFENHLKTWNSILSCNFNPNKMKIWQERLEDLFSKIIQFILQYDEQKIFEDIINLEINTIQTLHLFMTATMIDTFFITVSALISKNSQNFPATFTLCISVLEALIKYRKESIMDRLPSYLQQYRTLLQHLCNKSNSDIDLKANEIQKLAGCAHNLEKLTNLLSACKKHMARIAPHLIADILKQYEEVTLYPSVKVHLNNCLYSLMSLCDHYAVSYSMRMLGTASTEMFKVLYENYKKYYKYSGRV